MHRPRHLEYGRLHKESRVRLRNLHRILSRQRYGLFALRSVCQKNAHNFSPQLKLNTNDIVTERKFAPKFGQSFTGVLICFAICFVLAQVVRFVLDRENKERSRVHGPPTFEKGLEDLSDRENFSFRYAL